MAELLRISVVYALPERVFLRALRLPAGSSVADAVAASGLAAAYPETLQDSSHFGIHARRVTPETVLRDGDRVEVYRPLTQDPKQARRARAQRHAP